MAGAARLPQTVAMAPTRYARSHDAHLAYQVEGAGDPPILELSNGTNLSIDETADEPHWERYVARLAALGCLVRFDLRGVGLSDPLPASHTVTLESTVEDALAVMDDAGIEQAVVVGSGFGGAVGVMLAAGHPERVRSLVLLNATARFLRDDDYPHGFPAEMVWQWSEAITDTTGTADVPEELNDAVLYAPSLADDPDFRRWWSRASQRGASPTAARALARLYNQTDVRAVLPHLSVPTLIVQRRDVFILPVGHARYLADHIPGAELVVVPGADALPFAGDLDDLLGPVEEFLTGERHRPDPERVLATVLFTDIVGSTDHVVELGDRRWRETLLRHDAMVQRQLERFRGRLVKRTGDGSLATFDGPARAIDAAAAMVAGARQLGLVLRTGVHCGEVELLGEDIGGIAVHIAARVAALAGPGEVLVSRTVRDLVAGSGIRFEARGTHLLRGVPGDWELYAATPR